MERKEIKKQSRISMKYSYWLGVLVSLVGVLTLSSTFGSLTDLLSDKTGFSSSTFLLSIIRFYVPQFLAGTDPNTEILLSFFKAMINLVAGSLALPLYLASRAYSTINSRNEVVFICFGVLLFLLFLAFFVYPLRVGTKKYYLDREKDQKGKGNAVLYSFSSSYYINIVRTMILKEFLLSLASLTVVGGLILSYGFYFTETILADNPTMKARDVLKTSWKLTKGRKWSLFIVDCSFLGWDLLSLITFRLVGVLYVSPYRDIFFMKLYLRLKEEETKKDPALAASYARINEKAKKELLVQSSIPFDQDYPLLDIVLMFFLISMIGWVWEVSLHLCTDHEFVNRGTMYGPWLPIYGTGGVLVLLSLKKLRRYPWLTFIVGIVLCLSVEYLTSYVLEKWRGIRYWDYSDYPMNLDGRICLAGGLVFGAACVGMVYFIAPLFERVLKPIPIRIKRTAAIVLAVLFCVDLVFSNVFPRQGPGITTAGMLL
ncbi:MAG: DUF975 family protein [Bacilli bacterium]